MGKTRTALKNCVDHLFENQELFDGLYNRVRILNKDEMPHITEYIKNGVDVIMLHLAAEFKKRGSTLKDNLETKLADVMDSDMKKFFAGISKSGDLLLSKVEEAKNGIRGDLTKIEHVLEVAGNNAQLIRNNINAKKKGFMTDKNKNEKYQYYLELVTWIEEEVELQNKAVADIRSRFKTTEHVQLKKFVKSFCSIDESWTVEDITYKTDETLSKQLLEYEHGNDGILDQTREIRDQLKKAGPQIKKLQSMAAEADELDGGA